MQNCYGVGRVEALLTQSIKHLNGSIISHGGAIALRLNDASFPHAFSLFYFYGERGICLITGRLYRSVRLFSVCD